MGSFSNMAEVTLEDYLSKKMTHPPTSYPYPPTICPQWMTLHQEEQVEEGSKGGFLCPASQSIARVEIGRRKSRGAGGDGPKKNMERKEKRMIKNRESATRSRARKQAYTRQLENKILELEKENEELKMCCKESEIVYEPEVAEAAALTLRRAVSALF